MSYFSDNPDRDFDRWDMERERRLARRPCCDMCGARIKEETAIRLRGHWICESCIENSREVVDEFDFD